MVKWSHWWKLLIIDWNYTLNLCASYGRHDFTRVIVLWDGQSIKCSVPGIMRLIYCRGQRLLTKLSPVAFMYDARLGRKRSVRIFNSGYTWNFNFTPWLIVIYDKSNNQWSGSIAAQFVPKNSECKNPLEKFSPRFFGIKTTSSSLIIFQRAKLSTRSITHLCWRNWKTFWRKNAAGNSPRLSCFWLKTSRCFKVQY